MINILDIIGYDPHNLPENECNISNKAHFKVRALFKIMLFAHRSLNFPRMFDPDCNEYIRKYSPHTKKIEDTLPIDYDPEVFTKTKIANCGIYSKYFELLAKEAKFEVRHLGLKSPNGWNGHWCSEVKIDEKWIFFDTMYLICSVSINEKRIYHSAPEIMENPIELYFNFIPPLFKGISKEVIIDLWQGFEINKQTSYDLGLDKFIKLYYGENK